MAIDIGFLKKLAKPQFSLSLFTGIPTKLVGIDIGTYSTKVVQLRYERERAILETYGELINEGYFKGGAGILIRQPDSEIAELLKDVLRESGATAKDTVFAIPASSSLITVIQLPLMPKDELKGAIPYEARRYIPMPISEVALDWDILEENPEKSIVEILLAAIPLETVEKYKRVAKSAGLKLNSLEVESFSVLRSLARNDPLCTALINMGHTSTTVAIADRGKLRVSHGITQGSGQITKTIERGLGINRERAETIKREIGLSEKIEERETVSIITPLLDPMLAETERVVSLYNRRAPRAVQRINLTGGGSNLKGLVDYTSSKFGIEVTKGNPFGGLVTPAFMQPVLREIGSSFSVAVGAALHGFTSR